MDLQLTEEQDLLSQAMRQILTDFSNDSKIISRSVTGDVWTSLASFGVLDVGGPDGLGAVELVIIARALGEHLSSVPFRDSAATQFAVGERLKKSEENSTFAIAMNETGRPFAPLLAETTIAGGKLSGEKRSVRLANQVDLFAVTARASGGPALVLVDAASRGLQLDDEMSLDPSTPSFRIFFQEVEAEPNQIISGDVAAEVICRLGAIGSVLAAAEAVGAAARILEMARDYACQRSQFGRPIGSFQALRHILAAAYVKVESSWSSVLYAAASLDEGDESGRHSSAICKAYVARASLEVVHDSIQVFGGIAFTQEHPAHLYLRRIISLGDQFGTAREHELALGVQLTG